MLPFCHLFSTLTPFFEGEGMGGLHPPPVKENQESPSVIMFGFPGSHLRHSITLN